MALSASRIFLQIQEVAHRSRVNARQVAQEMCSRAPKSDAEACALLEFNARFRESDPDWDRRFCLVMADYVLSRAGAEGSLTAENLAWLTRLAAPEGVFVARNLLALWVRLLKKADQVPAAFDLSVLTLLCDRMVQEGSAETDLTDLIRQVLLLGGPPAAPWISRAEADILMRAHDRLEGGGTHPSWNLLFARAMGNYLVVRAHPNPQNERHALSRKHWLDPKDSHPGKFVGCLAVGLDKGRWFERLGHGLERAALARQAAGFAAHRQPHARSDRFNWWSRTAAEPLLGTADTALIDFLRHEAPGLLDGLVIAAR